MSVTRILENQDNWFTWNLNFILLELLIFEPTYLKIV